ncbi:MAG: nitroreductase family protein [Oscillospiraceae bacterium]|jgi:nitroreductase|nr:nitroreductase family protein [Oscillospiraceae bacterium]
MTNPTVASILARQSVREYKPVQISSEAMEVLVAAALRAPSGRNSQPCHVRFFQRAEELRAMQVDFKNIVGWDTPVHTRSDKNPFYHNAPTFAFIFAESDSRMDAGLMAENICIAAQSLELGTCIVASVGALFADAAAGKKWREILEIPAHFIFQIGICIGYPDEQPEWKPRNAGQVRVIGEKR